MACERLALQLSLADNGSLNTGDFASLFFSKVAAELRTDWQLSMYEDQWSAAKAHVAEGTAEWRLLEVVFF